SYRVYSPCRTEFDTLSLHDALPISTGGKNRFMPPKKPASWTGARDCFAYGQISPQTLADLRSDYGMMIQWDRHVGGMGEDVLSLDRKSTRLNSSHGSISYAVFCLKT